MMPRHGHRTEPPRRLSPFEPTEHNVLLPWALSNLIDLADDVMYRRNELLLMTVDVLASLVHKSPESLQGFNVLIIPYRVLLLNLLGSPRIDIVDLLLDRFAHAARTFDIPLLPLLDHLTSLTPGLVPPRLVLRSVFSHLSLKNFARLHQLVSVALTHLLALQSLFFKHLFLVHSESLFHFALLLLLALELIENCGKAFFLLELLLDEVLVANHRF